MRMLKVQGKGKVASRPDIVIITFEVEETTREYSECVTRLNQRTAALRSDVESVGRGRGELKTNDFSIQVNTKYTDGRHVFDGYQGRHTLHIEFPAERDILNQVLQQIARGNSGAEVKLRFTVKDKEALKCAALREAIKAAQRNAQIISEATGFKLGQIQQVDYGWTEIRIYDREANMVCEAASEPTEYNPDIDPEDVSAEDNVTLVFEIVD